MNPLHSRLLPWDACLNARELGGYPSLAGQHLRWKALVRSDNTWNLTPASVQALLDYGIRTVIDLRFEAELAARPSPLAQLPPDRLNYLNIPLEVDQDMQRKLLANPAAAISDMYNRMLETNRGYVAAVLTAIAQAPAGGVMFHCHAGKDRTGLIAACVLGLLGVPPEIIASDYAFTTPQLEARSENYLSASAVSAEERLYLRVLSSALPETMRRTLAYLDEHYGGVAGYVSTTALQDETVRALQARLLEG